MKIKYGKNAYMKEKKEEVGDDKKAWLLAAISPASACGIWQLNAKWSIVEVYAFYLTKQDFLT